VLSFKTDAVFQDDICRNWASIEKQVDDALYEVFLPPQAWLVSGTHTHNNERGDYLGFSSGSDHRAWTNMHVPPTWKSGSLGFEFLYTCSTTANTISIDLLANAVSIGESVDAGADVYHVYTLPPPGTAAFLLAHSDPSIRLQVNAGQHRLVTLRIGRTTDSNVGVWRFEGLIVRFGTGKREVHL